MTKTSPTNVFSLDTARQRRKYIALAEANEDWAQTQASFALSGIELTDDLAYKFGCMLAAEAEPGSK